MLTADQFLRLLDGALVTVQVFVFAAALGTVVAVVGGVASLAGSRLVRAVTRVYVELFRGVSAIILLFWTFYSLPVLLDLRLSPMQAGVLALGLNMGAYGTEIARGAIQAVPKGQTEATIALDLSAYQRLRYVVLPQAVMLMLPPYGNLLIELLKGTALVSTITLADIMWVGDQLHVRRAAEPVAIFGTVLVMYFVLSMVVTVGIRVAEAWFGRGLETRRGPVLRAG